MAEMMPFIFGGGSNMSLEELRRRQAAAAALAGQKRKFPTSLGEGMTYLGEAVGERMENDRLREAEAAQAALDRGAPVRPGSYRGAGAAGAPPRAAAPAGTRVPTERIAPAAAPAGAMPGVAPVVPGGSFSEAPTDPLDRIAMALANSPQEVAQMDPMLGAAVPPPGSPSDDEGMWSARQAAIGGIESSDDYKALGVKTKYGRAHGRYGVMETNVPKWTAEALGRPMTPQEFLNNDKAQDAVFRHKFGQLVAKYGEEKAARAWYGGEGNINNLDRTDVHEKLSVHDYGQDYINRLMKRTRRSSVEEPDAAPTPIRLAALGGPSGTMSDAPPIGAAGDQLALSQRMPANEKPPPPTYLSPRGAPQPPPQPAPMQPVQPQQRLNLAPTDVENPDQPTVTEDIRPMSVAPNMVAQVGSEMFSPRRMSDAPVAMGPNVAPLPATPRGPPGTVVTDIKPAPSLPPSRAPIPGAKEQEMPDPGPEPERPGRLGPSPAAVDNWKIWNDPRYSEQRRARAKEAYQEEERFRLEIQNQQQETYKDKRERWQQQRDAKDKFDREAHDRTIDQLTKRLGAEQAQVALEKAYFEQGIPRQQAIDKAASDIKEAGGRIEKQEYERTQRAAEERARAASTGVAERSIAKPETFESAGARYISPYTPGASGGPGTFGPYSLAPGSPPPKEEALTEPQQKATQFVLRTREDLTTLERDHGKALTDKFEAAKAWVPFGANLIHSSEYRKARNAVDNWGAAFMSHVSGAAITPSEAARQLPAFVPAAGDDDKELAEKTRRRRQFTDAVEASGGKPTHDAIMKVLKEAGDSVFDKEARKPDAVVTSPAEAAVLPPGRWFVGHDGQRRQRAVTP